PRCADRVGGCLDDPGRPRIGGRLSRAARQHVTTHVSRVGSSVSGRPCSYTICILKPSGSTTWKPPRVVLVVGSSIGSTPEAFNCFATESLLKPSSFSATWSTRPAGLKRRSTKYPESPKSSRTSSSCLGLVFTDRRKMFL